jgi:hypothetical protein
MAEIFPAGRKENADASLERREEKKFPMRNSNWIAARVTTATEQKLNGEKRN